MNKDSTCDLPHTQKKEKERREREVAIVPVLTGGVNSHDRYLGMTRKCIKRLIFYGVVGAIKNLCLGLEHLGLGVPGYSGGPGGLHRQVYSIFPLNNAREDLKFAREKFKICAGEFKICAGEYKFCWENWRTF